MKGRRILSMYLAVAAMTALLSSCCIGNTYGRYDMQVGQCVKIDGVKHTLSKQGNEYLIDAHTIKRGINRKYKPWVYVHEIKQGGVDITFDIGKGDYPLYTGSSASIFSIFDHPWEMTKSTNASLGNNHWTISHKWRTDGILFDVQEMGSSNLAWGLVAADLFVSSNGNKELIPGTNIAVRIVSFDYANKKAKVEFIQMP